MITLGFVYLFNRWSFHRVFIPDPAKAVGLSYDGKVQAGDKTGRGLASYDVHMGGIIEAVLGWE